MNEFELIDVIVGELGDAAAGDWVRIGPGDDAAVNAAPPGTEIVSTVDALVADVHFPAAAGAELIGYRSLMVSVSDLAAMGAQPGFVLVALSLPSGDAAWLRALARGIGRAARTSGVAIVGGNLARGPLSVVVSAHGYVPQGGAILRSGARAGDDLYVTGRLGAAAAALARGGLERCSAEQDLDELSRRYFLPTARIGAGVALRGFATSAIDLSDGLLQDVGHIARASGVGVELERALVPVAAGATLEQALTGGDDYELAFTGRGPLPELPVAAQRIGRITSAPGVRLDGQPAVGGYRHFDA